MSALGSADTRATSAVAGAVSSFEVITEIVEPLKRPLSGFGMQEQ